MRFLLVLLAVAAPVWAQESGPLRELSADLDGDGVAEAYRLLDNGTGTVDLVVAQGDRERVAAGIAWTGAMAGNQPELALSPAGSVLVASMNEAIGRDRWRLTLTIAHRDGDWRVAGVTYDWYDTLDPETGWGRCDINLLTGKGTAETAAGTRGFAVAGPAPLLWDWRDEAPPVSLDVCFAA